eukprot:TRINITY_DN20097_c0_g1_i1.p1 TRINITY_DN20097_c0_g1~~TRINITY_DN20097_c0_g1_i1.p1  ORF type:complete len:277 (-),score=66.53 TRINITY_DN20097_c0_g1_i1:165-995(-)
MWQAEEDGRTALLKGGTGAATGGVLEEYASEFMRLRAVATSRLQAVQESGGAVSAEEVKASEAAIDEMESNRRQVQVQLRLELSGAAGTARQEWEQRVQEWSREVKSLREQLGTLKEASNRRALNLGGSGSSAGAAERRSAVQATEMMERSSSKLQDAIRVSLETEEVSQGVVSDLAAQRETILRTRSNMRTIDTELSQARQSLGRMLAMAQRNRTMTLAIAAIFALGLSFWALCAFGLPLKTTLILAIGVLLLLSAAFLVRRRMQTGHWSLPLPR